MPAVLVPGDAPTPAEALFRDVLARLDSERRNAERLESGAPWARAWALVRLRSIADLGREVRAVRADPPADLEEVIRLLGEVERRLPSKDAPAGWEPAAWPAERARLLAFLPSAEGEARERLLRQIREAAHPAIQRCRWGVEELRRDAQRALIGARDVARRAVAARNIARADAALARLSGAELAPPDAPALTAAAILTEAEGRS